MVTLDKLIELAELEGIEIVYCPMPKSLKGYGISAGDNRRIYINSRLKGDCAEIKTILAEELGHFFTANGCAVPFGGKGSVTRIVEMRKREHQGLSWQAHCLAPIWLIEGMIRDLHIRELWQLAEALEVTQKFMWSRVNSGDVHHMQLRLKKMGVGR